MSNFQDTTLFTYDRLSEFVNNYNTKINSIKTKAEQTAGGLYEYYNFEYSPKGIQTTDIKRIPQQILSACTNWTSFIQLNTPDSWKLNAGKKYLQIKQQDVNYSKTLSKTQGLTFTLITIPSIPTDYNSFKSVSNTTTYINAFVQNNNPSIYASGIATSLDGYSTSFSDPDGVILTNFAMSGVQGFACEWYGYFYPSNGAGTYTFNISGITSGAGYYYAWIGSKAICEYTVSNVDIYTSSSTFKIIISEEQYYPIRIQFFANNIPNITSSQINLALSIQKSGTTVNNCLFTLKNSDGSTYYPLLQYCAFVSLSPANLQQGLFQFYYNDLTNSSTNNSIYGPDGLYTIINNYKFNMQNGVFDIDDSNQRDYGTLPDATNWTPVQSLASETSDPKPYAYSMYRLDVDLRMGNAYQINPVANSDGTYTMNPMNANLLSYASTYNQFPNYYPSETTNNTQILSNFTTNLLQTATNDTPAQCESNCNNNTNCGYYYTYMTENKIPQCVIDTDNSEPTFNQIPPTNPNNSTETYIKGSLFLREKQFIQPKCPGETITANGLQYNPNYVSFTNVINTDQYSASFPFAKYQLGEEINNVSGIGICGDPKNGLSKQTNEAKAILFENALYTNYGSSWTEGMQPMSPSSKETDAMKDTTDSIRAGLYNQQQYANMMNTVNANYQKLTTREIPHYLETRKILESNPDYDYNGNTLLYYNSEPVPTIQQQRVIDADQGVVKQNSLYILGTLTAATLLVLALILGKE